VGTLSGASGCFPENAKGGLGRRNQFGSRIFWGKYIEPNTKVILMPPGGKAKSSKEGGIYVERGGAREGLSTYSLVESGLFGTVKDINGSIVQGMEEKDSILKGGRKPKKDCQNIC